MYARGVNVGGILPGLKHYMVCGVLELDAREFRS